MKGNTTCLWFLCKQKIYIYIYRNRKANAFLTAISCRQSAFPKAFLRSHTSPPHQRLRSLDRVTWPSHTFNYGAVVRWVWGYKGRVGDVHDRGGFNEFRPGLLMITSDILKRGGHKLHYASIYPHTKTPHITQLGVNIAKVSRTNTIVLILINVDVQHVHYRIFINT